MSNIPAFPYDILWREKRLLSVANLTRRDAEEFLALAPQILIFLAFMIAFDGWSSIHFLPETVFAGLEDFTLVSLPMFIIMGAGMTFASLLGLLGKDFREAKLPEAGVNPIPNEPVYEGAIEEAALVG